MVILGAAGVTAYNWIFDDSSKGKSSSYDSSIIKVCGHVFSSIELQNGSPTKMYEREAKNGRTEHGIFLWRTNEGQNLYVNTGRDMPYEVETYYRQGKQIRLFFCRTVDSNGSPDADEAESIYHDIKSSYGIPGKFNIRNL